jgi:hypothetical protein
VRQREEPQPTGGETDSARATDELRRSSTDLVSLSIDASLVAILA